MPYTFGGVVGSRATFTVSPTMGASGSAGVFTGWFRPTTLTATRRYFSAGSIFGAEVASTTSEITLRTDNTTDGQWTTSGAGITTNKWYFIAIMWSTNNTGPAAAWRVWIGTEDTPPVEVTVTQNTAPVGNFTGSGTLTFGNTGANNVSYQGDLAEQSLLTITTLGWLGLTSTAGTITQGEADRVLTNYVQHMWRGDVHRAIENRAGAGFGFYYWSAEPLSSAYRRSLNAVVTADITPTTTSAVISTTTSSPRPCRYPLNAPQRALRR